MPDEATQKSIEYVWSTGNTVTYTIPFVLMWLDAYLVPWLMGLTIINSLMLGWLLKRKVKR